MRPDDGKYEYQVDLLDAMHGYAAYEFDAATRKLMESLREQHATYTSNGGPITVSIIEMERDALNESLRHWGWRVSRIPARKEPGY